MGPWTFLVPEFLSFVVHVLFFFGAFWLTSFWALYFIIFGTLKITSLLAIYIYNSELFGLMVPNIFGLYGSKVFFRFYSLLF